METIKIPLAPQWSSTSNCVSTPDDGVLYIGWNIINYISKIENDQNPTMKLFHIRQKVKCLDCDLDWSKTKRFVILAEDNTVQIWDFNENRAIKGHKSHVKQVLDDGEIQRLDNVQLCYLKNRKVLSIDSSSFVFYCPASNTYIKRKRFIRAKYEISIIKGSPHNEDILALGTAHGLVLVVDLGRENIMYTLRGHETGITSLSWNTTSDHILSRLKNDQNNCVVKNEIEHKDNDDNDPFDIFDFDYLKKDTFGVISNNSIGKPIINGSDDDNHEYEKTKDVIENENFNYVEACQNLKDDILSIASSNHNYSINNDLLKNCGAATANISKNQVTLADCQQQQQQNLPKCKSDSSESFLSPRQSVDLNERSSDIIFDDDYDDDDEDKNQRYYDEDDGGDACEGAWGGSTYVDDTENCEGAWGGRNYVDVNDISEGACGRGYNVDDRKPKKCNLDGSNYDGNEVFLASGSRESFVWIWNINTGAAVQSLQLKEAPQNVVNAMWLNKFTLVTVSRSGEISVWQKDEDDQTNISFVLQKDLKNHRNVISSCKLKNSDIIWTISSQKEILCCDIRTDQIIAKYSCASTNVSVARECPTNMNKIAFGCGDKRICIIDLSGITPTNVSIISFTNKIDAAIYSISWCPKGRYVAFGTSEGRVGVINVEKANSNTFTLKPFCGKPIYSIQWWGNNIFVCGNEKVCVYDWNDKLKAPQVLENITEASSINVQSLYLIVGTQHGFLNIFKRDNENSIDFEKITITYAAPKYISEIAFNPIDTNKFAISSLANKIVVFALSPENDILKTEIVLMMDDYSSGNALVKWSNKNKNLLLSCGFDGVIRVWDLSLKTNELIFLKQYQSPMFCGLFSPINENIIICGGKATSIEMFDMNKETTSVINLSTLWKKNKSKPLDLVSWATKLCNNEKKTNKKCKSLKKNDENTDDANVGCTEEISSTLHKLKLNENESTMEPSTILHLTNKEINRNPLKTLLNVLDNETSKSKSNFFLKFFGSRKDIQELLNEELRNHEASATKSAANVIIPQLGCSLKNEIIKAIENKKLTAQHVALSPTISYQFWKNCCLAYANQLIETGLSLQATSYYIACHEINECIKGLLNNKYYREAFIIAKIYCEDDNALLNDIIEKWINYLDASGALEVGALICVLSERYERCLTLLSKRRQMTDEHKKIINIVETRLEKK